MPKAFHHDPPGPPPFGRPLPGEVVKVLGVKAALVGVDEHVEFAEWSRLFRFDRRPDLHGTAGGLAKVADE